MQTAIVSLIAFGALLLVARKVVAAVRPPKPGEAGCPSCASGDPCATTPASERAR